jgi:hypothetical protein
MPKSSAVTMSLLPGAADVGGRVGGIRRSLSVSDRATTGAS